MTQHNHHQHVLPHSHSSPSTSQATPPSSDKDRDKDDARPPHTSEIGTLKKLPNDGTAWLGSSSGVYFVNTVRRAFSAAFSASNSSDVLPASEDILTGEDAEGRSYNGPVTEGPASTDEVSQVLGTALGRPPPEHRIAVELVMSFFQAWHPLFPFLHGPSFLRDMEWLYGVMGQAGKTTKKKGKGNASTTTTTMPTFTSQEICKALTFQLVINIASLDRTDIQLAAESRIKSIADVTRVAGSMALDHDLGTIQMLLAANLYLVATLAIRQASTVSGIIVKLIYHAGLHRCPLRYSQFSAEDCEIRKRVFWSAYGLDRHCSLSLGDPNTIQDDDIDVCLSGKELHKTVARDRLSDPGQEIALHMRAAQMEDAEDQEPDEAPATAATEGPEAREKRIREAALTAYVHWGRLTGRIMEIFHKSINHRFPKQEQILYLDSDIETWWNDLPSFLTAEDTADSADSASQPQHFSSFFKILYHRLLLLLNRPRLSLDQSTAEFQHGLQVCIRASRNILSGLKSHKSNHQSMFLPGLLSTAWMSGLIIAFACQLGKYPKPRACSDIHSCLSLLESMNLRWYTVKNCHKVLTLLLGNIEGRRASTNGYLAVIKPEQLSPSESTVSENPEAPRKKQRRSIRTPPSFISKKEDVSDGGNASSTTSIQIPATSSLPFGQAEAGSILSNVNPPGFDSTAGSGSFEFPNWDGGQPLQVAWQNPGWGAAVYANPQDMAFAQSNMALPDVSSNTEDPMFWSNIDYNVADVFGSATWENMTGPFAPGWDANMGV